MPKTGEGSRTHTHTHAHTHTLNIESCWALNLTHSRCRQVQTHTPTHTQTDCEMKQIKTWTQFPFAWTTNTVHHTISACLRVSIKNDKQIQQQWQREKPQTPRGNKFPMTHTHTHTHGWPVILQGHRVMSALQLVHKYDFEDRVQGNSTQLYSCVQTHTHTALCLFDVSSDEVQRETDRSVLRYERLWDGRVNIKKWQMKESVIALTLNRVCLSLTELLWNVPLEINNTTFTYDITRWNMQPF